MQDRPDGWGVATRVAGVALVASTVALGATGVPLIWRYVPPSHGGLRGAHVVAGVAFVCSAIALLVVALLRRLSHGGRSSPGWLAALAVVGVGVGGIVTGRMIAWDWLALWAVTVGGNVRGVWHDSEQIRFVIVDGREVPLGTYRFWTLVHVLLLPLLCAGAAAVAIVRRRGSAAAEQPALSET